MTGLYEWYSSLTYSWFAAIDYIGAIFWSLTYVAILFTAFFNKSEKRFPINATTIFVNLSWEIASVIVYVMAYGFGSGFTRAAFIRYSWLILDIFILIIFSVKCKRNNNIKILLPYSLLLVTLTVIFFLCFERFEYGMVISSFIIDAHMEVLFWKNRKKLDPCNRLAIAVLKIFGDFFAGIYYGRDHIVVFVLAVIAFVFNVMYIVYAIKERKAYPEIKEHFHYELVLFYKNLKARILPKKNYQKRRKYKKRQKNKKTHRKK